jgi:hypothetical protein
MKSELLIGENESNKETTKFKQPPDDFRNGLMLVSKLCLAFSISELQSMMVMMT